MPTELNDKQKQWVLSLSGKDLYSKTFELKNQNKIDNGTLKMMFAFWLNQHDMRHDEAYTKIVLPKRDQQGRNEFIIENITTPKLYWEKYDENISAQTVKNEKQAIWNKNRNRIMSDINEVFK